MSLRVLALTFVFGSLPTPAIAAEKATPADPAAEKAAEAAIRKALNATGPAIDGCTQRYLVEQPDAKGKARVDVKVKADGAASKATVSTALPQARTLRLCLEDIANGWRFPKPREATTMGITLVVEKGVKFRVPSPEEKAKQAEKKTGDGASTGFLQLGGFLPAYPTGKSSN